jgi:4-amino-4-deoxy-L-arabinose transferase-like glycosyltransferase
MSAGDQPGPDPAAQRTRTRDLALVAAVCFALAAVAFVGGRPLTVHESRLPQTAREMLATGDWLVPRSGGRPWLERPPLPIWIVAGFEAVFGSGHSEWPARVPSALAACVAAVLAAWMAGRMFGPAVGVLSGLLLVTMFEFVTYAWLAEHDIYLCALVAACVATFVHVEFPGAQHGDPECEAGRPPAPSRARLASAGPAGPERRTGGLRLPSPLGRRRPALWVLFILIGTTSIVKGPAIGLVMTAIPILARLALCFSLRRLMRYVWVWGWLAFAVVHLAWPVAVILKCPGALDLWRFDVLGRITGEYAGRTEPPWYYLAELPGEMLPWTPLALIGAVLAARRARRRRRGPHAFVLVWAVAAVAIMSVPRGKHHHYLLSCLPAWAMLAAMGALWARNRLFALPRALRHPLAAFAVVGVGGGAAILAAWGGLWGPPWLKGAAIGGLAVCGLAMGFGYWRRRGRLVLFTTLVLVLAAYAWGHVHEAAMSDGTSNDIRFLRRVGKLAEPGTPLLFNGDGGSMGLMIFRIPFYLPDRAHLLHNLTYLLDERIEAGQVYVVTRARDEPALRRYGRVEVVDQSRRTHRERGPSDRLTLFRLRFREDLRRYTVPSYVTPMQAMGREPGPELPPP